MRALRTVLISAVAAGLIGGALASAFHGLFTEPVIDRAIAAEEQRAAAQPGHHGEEAVVSRRGQKIGLVVGLLLYGATWGLLVGLALEAMRGWAPPAWSLARRGAVLAGLLGWSVAIFPFLKYPANPPGVGEPASIGYRQTLYVGFIALAVLGLVLATALRRRTGGWLAPGAFYGAWALGIYVLMPSNPDPVELSQAIVRPFRALSLAGLVIFWSALSAVLAVLVRNHAVARSRGPRTASPAGSISSRASA
jgi:putative cobalt transporter subunit CbtA